jgi:LacI family transcriptional regulator
MRTTIKDIAQKTGLSITTVSLVLNGKADKISEESKELVLRVAKELNYRPNQIAVGLVKKRTNTLGLIIPDISNIFFSELAKGVEDEGRKYDYNVILCNTNDRHDLEVEYVNVLAAKGIDGIILDMSVEDSEEKARKSLSLLLSYGIPAVIVDRYSDDKNFTSIYIDNEQGAYLATQYLIDLGHKRIGCVTGPSSERTSMDRLRGYSKAMQEHNIPLDEELILEGKYQFWGGYNAAKELMNNDITAIFAFNDMMAYGVARALRENNVSIPKDVSLMGFDDIFFSEIFDIPLTTVRQPTYEIGQIAVKTIIDEIENGKKIREDIVLQPKLQIRKSTRSI